MWMGAVVMRVQTAEKIIAIVIIVRNKFIIFFQMFLSDYCEFEFSFWRHPFTAENALVSKWCNAKFLQICSNKDKLVYILDGPMVVSRFFLSKFLFLPIL